MLIVRRSRPSVACLAAGIGLVLGMSLPQRAEAVTNPCENPGLVATVALDPDGTTEGTGGDDVIIGDDARNVIYPLQGDDIVCGRGGNDEIDGYQGNDFIDGGSNLDDGPFDKLDGGDGDDTILGGVGRDDIDGNPGDDYIDGGSGPDHVQGEFGNDTLIAGPADEEFFDWVDYRCRTGGCAGPYGNVNADPAVATGEIVDLDAGTAQPVNPALANQGFDTVVNFEGLQGSDYGDVLLGQADDTDYIWPRGGDDFVDARGGVRGDYVDYVICEDVYALTGDPDLIGCADPSNTASDKTGVTIDLQKTGSTPGNRAVEGGQGSDQLIGVEHVVGSVYGDVIAGSAARNEIFGERGADVVSGRDGDDVIAGDAGNDLVSGDGGDDAVRGDDGDDGLAGGEGRDLVTYEGVDCGPGGAGVDAYLQGGTATGEGQDTLSTIETLLGSACNDVLSGTSGPDSLYGSGGADHLFGRDGNDVLVAHALVPRALDGVNGEDWLSGGAGDDTASYAGAANGITADLAVGDVSDGDGDDDHLLAIEAIVGSTHGDSLVGSPISNLLLGGAGDDHLGGRGSNDYLDGGSGIDTMDGGAGRGDTVDYRCVDYSGTQCNPRTSRLAVNLAGGTVDFIGSAGQVTDTESLARGTVEGLAGTDQPDVLRGDGFANFLFGEGGADAVYGRKGNDGLYGGADPDRLFGSKGTDRCVGEQRRGCESSAKLKTSCAPAPARSPFAPEQQRLVDWRCFRVTGEGQLGELRSDIEDARDRWVHRHDAG
jgi:Ca2+-binding RTX toxin-like protein